MLDVNGLVSSLRALWIAALEVSRSAQARGGWGPRQAPRPLGAQAPRHENP